MIHRDTFRGARWLIAPDCPDAALFRKDFSLRSICDAQITICGLGYFRLTINGKRVGNDEFVPPVSDYHARNDMVLSYPINDRQSHRIYVMRYDIADYLHEGENVIGVAVGGGFYNQTKRLAEGNMSYGDVKLCFLIETETDRIESDSDVICSRGYYRSVNLFHGEVHDYTGFDRHWDKPGHRPAGWSQAVCVLPPESEYYITDCPTDKVVEILRPELVKDHGDYSVYRVSRNITGYPVIHCDAPGELVELECAENLFEDDTLNNRSVGFGEQRQRATFFTDWERTYHPEFTWFGFRYFSLTNNARPVEVRVIHADVPVTSSFECSDPLLNWYHDTFINTQQCNMHGSIPSDCPHRERLGYTGDGQLTCDAVMTQFDAASFYRKWIYDILDCQDANTGHVQHTAPFAGGGGGPAGWGGAIIAVPYVYLRHTGDIDLLRKIVRRMQRYVGYIESHCDDGLIVREEKDGWCLGEWCTPDKVQIPEPFVNTTLYISLLRQLLEITESLGKPISELTMLIDCHTEALRQAYEKDGVFCAGVQGADAFALDCGIGDERTLQNLVRRYTQLGEFDTGIFGTPILLRVLFENGYEDLAYTLLSNCKDGSFDAMRRGGATTLWENWNGEASHNHPMFGAATVCLFRYILGIKQTPCAHGMRDFVISPVFPKGLNHASGHITTPAGKLAVQWKREGDHINLHVDVCEGIHAELQLKNLTAELSAGSNDFTVSLE